MLRNLPSKCRNIEQHDNTSQRRGAVLLLTAFLMVFLLAIIAFAVDLGYVAVVHTELQRAADAAAFAGGGQLINGTTAAKDEAISYLSKNKVGKRTLSSSNATVEFGTWNSTSRSFTTNNTSPNAIRVTATNNAQPTFFARVLGKNTFDTKATATCVYQPRDVALVLDYSGSMCYDSQFINMDQLGKAAIEANLLQIWTELGSPKYGSMTTFAPVKYGTTSTSNSSVRSNFNLNSVSYPYAKGSWDEYIDFVQSDSYLNAAGYRCYYGMETFLDYLLSERNMSSETSGLWAVSEQPLTAVKDAVDVFLSYLTAHSTDDRVSFTLYSYSDNTAILEQSLTSTYTSVSTKVRQRQAGHYVGGTNISGGMNKGRIDLQNNGRAGALKMMVLMTDGVANLPSGNSTSDKNAVITEANSCKTAGIPVITIGVGADADTALLQQVASITGGACFIIPGGQSATALKTQLEAVFGQVAADRPLKLVQ